MTSFTVEDHLNGRSPIVCEIYETIVTCAREFGPVKEDPKKTSIHLNRKSAFAGIQTRKDFLILTIKSTTNIGSRRISKREQASASRWHHEIKLRSADEVDNEIVQMLHDSYELSG